MKSEDEGLGFFGHPASKGDKAHGYASSKDTERYYCQDQEMWRKLSAEQIAHISNQIQKENPQPSFERLYRACALARLEIAKALKHGKEEGTTSRFGTFREPGERIQETFFKDDDKKQAWPLMKEAVLTEMQQLVDTHFKDAKDGCYRIQGNSCFEGRLTVFSDEPDGVDTYELEIKSSELRDKIQGHPISSTLNKLIYMIDKGEPKKTSLYIEYAPFYPEVMAGNFKLAEEYYAKALTRDVSTDAGKKDFIREIAKLMHLMAPLLPIKRGNAGVCEWIMRGMADAKGLDLGPFNHEAGTLSWDFKALLTPSREEYADWFEEHAFSKGQAPEREASDVKVGP